MFEQVIASAETDYDLFDLFVRIGVHVSIESVLRVFYNEIRHVYQLIEQMTGKR